jgi:hypothetical protein
MALDRQPVTRTIVAEVCRDFRLTTSGHPTFSTPGYPLTEPSTEPSPDAAGNGTVETAADSPRPLDIFRRNRTRLDALVSPLRGGRVTHT